MNTENNRRQGPLRLAVGFIAQMAVMFVVIMAALIVWDIWQAKEVVETSKPVVETVSGEAETPEPFTFEKDALDALQRVHKKASTRLEAALSLAEERHEQCLEELATLPDSNNLRVKLDAANSSLLALRIWTNSQPDTDSTSQWRRSWLKKERAALYVLAATADIQRVREAVASRYGVELRGADERAERDAEASRLVEGMEDVMTLAERTMVILSNNGDSVDAADTIRVAGVVSALGEGTAECLTALVEADVTTQPSAESLFYIKALATDVEVRKDRISGVLEEAEIRDEVQRDLRQAIAEAVEVTKERDVAEEAADAIREAVESRETRP